MRKIKRKTVLDLYMCAYNPQIKKKGFFYHLADIYQNGNKLHLVLSSKPQQSVDDMFSSVNEILFSKNCTKTIKSNFKIVLLHNFVNSDFTVYEDKVVMLDKQGKARLGSIISNLLPFAKNLSASRTPFLPYFKFNNKSNYCFVELDNGQIGFKYDNMIFPPSHKKTLPIINVSAKDKFSINLCSYFSVEKVKIIRYGIDNNYFAKEIKDRILLFQRILSNGVSYKSYFNFIFDHRDNSRIAPYFKMLLNVKSNEYERALSFVVDKTLKVFLHPELLSIPVPKLDEKSTVLAEIKPSDIKEQFTYIDYRETNGIYYSLSNEDETLSDEFDLTVSIANLKKFAYIPSNVLDKYFSLLSVNIQPNNNRIQFKYFKDKWNEIILPIKIDQYTATIDTSLSGIVKILWNVVTLVAHKINIFERKSTVSHNNSNSAYIKREHRYKNQNAMIELHRSRSMNSNANVLVINQQELKKGMVEKKMHYRIGHWHYYWYGAHNSTERHKELKWVEETIVNREAANIVIVL